MQAIILNLKITTVLTPTIAGFIAIVILSAYISFRRNRGKSICMASYMLLSLSGAVTIAGLMATGYVLMLIG